MRRRVTIAVLLLLLTLSSAAAQPARRGLYTDHALQGGMHPAALALTSRLWYRIPLQEQRGVLWDPAKLDLGVRNQLSPAFEEFGAYLYWEPVALFDFTAIASVRQTITPFEAGFYELSGYDASYDNLADTGSDESKTGFRFTFAPRLKAAYGPLLGANELRVEVFDFGSNVSGGGERYFYEPVYDTVLSFRDTVVANTFLILYAVTQELRLGGHYYLRHVPDAGETNHRLAAMAVYTRSLRDHLSLFASLLGGSYVEDRYYRGDLYLAGQLGIQARLGGSRE
jgi:hypothetical protein